LQKTLQELQLQARWVISPRHFFDKDGDSGRQLLVAEGLCLGVPGPSRQAVETLWRELDVSKKPYGGCSQSKIVEHKNSVNREKLGLEGDFSTVKCT
jgi:hypothetical protein